MLTPTPLPITLGTAQLGIPYGIGEASKGLDDCTVHEILETAWSNNIRSLDTARAYGVAEQRIGRWMANRGSTEKFRIVSKFPALTNCKTVEALDIAFETSCIKLGINFIDVYLAHRSNDLLQPLVAKRLREMVANGLVGTFGASIYDIEEGDELLNIEGLGALQLPIHVSNVAMHESGFLTRAKQLGVTIFSRSVFLQGLLIKPLNDLSGRFRRALPVLQRLDALAHSVNSSRLALALSVVRACPGVSSIVIGTDSPAQLVSVVRAMTDNILLSTVQEAIEIGRTLPKDLCDPRKWGD